MMDKLQGNNGMKITAVLSIFVLYTLTSQWWVVNMFKNQLVHNQKGRNPGSDGWCPSSLGGLKLNTDAAVLPGWSSFGVRAVIRDSEGQVVIVLSRHFQGYFLVEVYEALALREGLCLENQHGFSIGRAEVDAANFVAGVNSSKPCKSVACFVFDDISSMCKNVGVFSCKAIFRCGNGLAHNLASWVVSSLKDQLWQGYCLFCLLAVRSSYVVYFF
ncbi:hypothetical protein QYF36_025026 [Acer negundo]|nr:hypothetical protein QYF36_025026 [Acer negundo]